MRRGTPGGSGVGCARPRCGAFDTVRALALSLAVAVGILTAGACRPGRPAAPAGVVPGWLSQAGGFGAPAWSCDGSRIAAYVQGQEREQLAVVAVSTRRVRVVDTGRSFGVESGGSPAWSPKGMQIAYVKEPMLSVTGVIATGPPPPEELVVADVTTGQRRSLPLASAAAQSPCWSPDERQVAFLSQNARGAPTLSVAAVGPPLQAVRSVGCPFEVFGFRWPTGETCAIVGAARLAGAGSELVRIGLRTGAWDRITSCGGVSPWGWSEGAEGSYCIWQELGKRIALARWDPRAKEALPLLTLDKKAFRPSIYASWTRDCRRAAIVGGGSLWLYDARSGSLRRATRGPQDSHPCWSPDGAKIAFVRDYRTVVIMDADTGGSQMAMSLGK